jgi:hypothetical protein
MCKVGRLSLRVAVQKCSGWPFQGPTTSLRGIALGRGEGCGCGAGEPGLPRVTRRSGRLVGALRDGCGEPVDELLVIFAVVALRIGELHVDRLAKLLID